MAAPKSLYEMATAVALKNISSIISVGYLSYSSVRHILLKVDDARQLRQLELNCPQLQGETGELWLKLIEKDFPLEFRAHAYMPKSQDRWHKVWERYKADRDRSLQESEEQLRAALNGLRQDKAKNTSKIVEGRFVPADVKRTKKRTPKDSTTSVLTFGGGSRTKMRTGADVMRKARREAKEVRSIQGTLSRSVVTPIRVLEKQYLPAGAPAGMVDEQRIAAQPAFRTPEEEQREKQRQEIEKKRAAALAEHAQRASYITDDSEEDSDSDLLLTTRKSAKRPAPAPAAGLGSSSSAATAPAKKPALAPTAGPSSSSAAPPPASAKPPPVPGRKVPGSGGSMFQRKFGAGKSTKPPPKPLRVANTTTTSTTPKKRTSSAAGLAEPATPPPKRPDIKPVLLSPNKVLPETVSPPSELPKGLTVEQMSLPKLPKAVRKKKPVNVFMKRPAKRT